MRPGRAKLRKVRAAVGGLQSDSMPETSAGISFRYEFCISALKKPCGPQPSGGGSPLFAPELGVPSAAACFRRKCLSANSVALRPAARNRPPAEGCILTLLESKPIRPAAGRSQSSIEAGKYRRVALADILCGIFEPRRGRRAAAFRRRKPAVRTRTWRTLRRLLPEVKYMSKRARQPFVILNIEF